jgi:hypothetical protein
MKMDQKLKHVRQAETGSLRDLGGLLQELSNPVGPVKFPVYAVAGLPAAADYANHVVICSNGASGDPILAFSDGSDWLRSDDGTAVDATP